MPSLRKFLPRKRWLRGLIYTLSTLLILLALDVLYVQYLRRITISKETTYLTEPLGPTGYPDYLTALHNKHSQGITPENNAAILIFQIKDFGTPFWFKDGAWRRAALQKLGVDSIPETVEVPHFQYWYDHRNATSRPNKMDYGRGSDEADAIFKRMIQADITLAQEPWMADWINETEPSLALMHQIIERPKYYLPLLSTPPELAGNPGAVYARHPPAFSILRSLALNASIRALVHLAHGDNKAFEADLLAIYRLSQLVSQGITLGEQLVAVSIDGYANTALFSAAKSGRMDDAQLTRIAAFLQDLPMADPFRNSLEVERYQALDGIMSASIHGISSFLSERVGNGPDAPRLGWSRRIAVDYLVPTNVDDTLRRANTIMDENIAILRIPSFRESRRLYDAKNRDTHLDLESASITDPGHMLVLATWVHFFRTRALSDFRLARRNLTALTLRLIAYQRQHGEYPATLDQLGTTIPRDPLGDDPLQYRRENDGFIVYSVGGDGIDNRGTPGKFDDHHGHDIVFRIGPIPANP